MDDLKKTCLYDNHVALKAQMSPFGGFMMPIQYSSIIEEHNAVRQTVGMFDVSHMGEIFVSGADAEKFVNHIFTNDATALPAGKILYGMMLYEDGGVVDDLLVYKMAEPLTWLLVVNASNIEKDEAWIRQQSEGFAVEISNKSDAYGQIALQGPDAERTAKEVLGLDLADLVFYTFKETAWDGKPLIVSRTGYTGEDGFEFYMDTASIVKMWERFIAAGVTPCGLGCRDTLRFESGLPLYGHELSAEISPIMAGLGMFVKLDKPEFIGRDACAKQKAEGTAKKVVGIELKDRAIPRGGYAVEADGVQIGEVTTGYHTITTGRSVCLALIDSRYAALGTAVDVRIRKKVFAGTVCKKRFYDKKYKK